MRFSLTYSLIQMKYSIEQESPLDVGASQAYRMRLKCNK